MTERRSFDPWPLTGRFSFSDSSQCDVNGDPALGVGRLVAMRSRGEVVWSATPGPIGLQPIENNGLELA